MLRRICIAAFMVFALILIEAKGYAQEPADPAPQANLEAEKRPEKNPGVSSDVSLYNNRGYDSYKEGKYDLAIEDYNRALEIDPKDALVLANRANAYSAKRDFDKAIDDYNKALETDPNDFKIYHDLGLTYINKGDFNKAIFYFDKTLQVNPESINNAQFHNDRAVAYFWAKQYDKCWEDVNKAIELGYAVHPEFLKALKEATGRQK